MINTDYFSSLTARRNLPRRRVKIIKIFKQIVITAEEIWQIQLLLFI